MSALDDARREELAEALRTLEGPGRAGTATWPEAHRDTYSLALEEGTDALAPLIARWLDEARAVGAAEVRARVEEVVKPQWRAVPPNVLDTESTLSAFRAGRNWVLDQLRAALTPPDTT